jgi:hypothetical protein
MMTTLRASKLTTFSVAPDGATVSIGVADDLGEPAALVLPSSCLQALVMTVPEMASQALQRKSGDPKLRLVFPVANWTLERATGSDRLILTFLTTDAYRVSFALSVEELVKIVDTALADEEAGAADAASCPMRA